MNVAVIGASGAIGKAFVKHFLNDAFVEEIYAFSRSPVEFCESNVISSHLDITDEKSIKNAISSVDRDILFDRIIVTTGILHINDFLPEKSLKDLSADKFEMLYAINTIGPALVAKHFLSRLNTGTPSVFAALSARVGSIEDNYLGGWYAYRSSKAALNMILKSASIELKRSNENGIILALHPGTVDSHLSVPFQKNVPAEKLFTPEYSVSKLMNIIKNVSPEDSGKFFAWDGQEIAY